jgi:regulator of sirC expression with transglutaminase-like and TPR domain
MDDHHHLFAKEIAQKTINLQRAALSFARSLAYPDLDVDAYITRIERLADQARPVLLTQVSLPEKVDALSDFLFYQMEFRGARGNTPGNTDDEYTNPENSFLNRVLDRRVGIPISLSVLFIAVARRLGMSAYGISLPGHFIAGVYDSGTEIYLDPYNAGIRLSIPDCGRLVREATGSSRPFQPKWLSPAAPSDILVRMLTNLCNAYIQREEWHNAIPVVQHMLMLQPEMDFHLRDLGYLYMYEGSLRLSANYFENYLRRVPEASDFETVRSSLEIVAGRLALWN